MKLIIRKKIKLLNHFANLNLAKKAYYMSHWNYRIMKRLNNSGDYEFGIYEVYYDDKGNVTGCTENSITPTCSSEKDLLFELETMKEAFKKETILFE